MKWTEEKIASKIIEACRNMSKLSISLHTWVIHNYAAKLLALQGLGSARWGRQPEFWWTTRTLSGKALFNVTWIYMVQYCSPLLTHEIPWHWFESNHTKLPSKYTTCASTPTRYWRWRALLLISSSCSLSINENFSANRKKHLKKKQFLDIGWYWFHLVLICFNEIGEHHVNDVQMHCMPCQDKVKHCNAFYLAFFCQSTSFCCPASRLPFSAAWEGKTKVFQTHGPFFPCQISS